MSMFLSVVAGQGGVKVPGAPGTLSLANGTNTKTQINLSWSAPSDTGGGTISGYRIKKDGSVLVADTSSTGTTYTASGLTAGTSYTFNVAAINEKGTGADGNTPSHTTAANLIATGGTITTYSGYKVHSFLSSGTFTITSNGPSDNIDVLVVGGGANGGSINTGFWESCTGGGGNGGVLTDTATGVVQAYTVVVGAGGYPYNSSVVGPDGYDEEVTYSGSGGLSSGGSADDDGGGGGGAGYYSYSGTSGNSHTGGSGEAYGNNGGNSGKGQTSDTWGAAGGGGGAAAVGGAGGTSGNAGSGGAGEGNVYRTGSTVYYGGGGGGGACANGASPMITVGAGGSGGGGAGGGAYNGGTVGTPTAGGANTGGAGGGGGSAAYSNYSQAHANGGSGIVVIRYPFD